MRDSSCGVTVKTTLTEQVDFEQLETQWRALETRSGGSFFQSWTWVGCMVRRRFPKPVLVTASIGACIVGLALFNRTRLWPFDRLWLGETGDQAFDCIYVEYNGYLLDREAPASTARCMTNVALREPLNGAALDRRLVLAGVGVPMQSGIPLERLVQTSTAPWIDFATTGPDYLASLSANTRYQIRRSNRHYEQSGPLTIHRAEDKATALTFLDSLAVLHQRAWTDRGKPGAFAQSFFVDFHRDLIARGLPRNEIDLLRIAAGNDTVGYLYNFRHRGRVLAYQSGFDYGAASQHAKPGMTCHYMAIERARNDGCTAYDFLAGDDRYKKSLANAEAQLLWLEAARTGSAATSAERLLRRVLRPNSPNFRPPA